MKQRWNQKRNSLIAPCRALFVMRRSGMGGV
jgi:hypothetical protein